MYVFYNTLAYTLFEHSYLIYRLNSTQPNSHPPFPLGSLCYRPFVIGRSTGYRGVYPHPMDHTRRHPPPDRAPPKTEYISSALKGYTTFLSLTCWLSWAAILAVLMKYRKTKLLKASQPPMLALILLGEPPIILYHRHVF